MKFRKKYTKKKYAKHTRKRKYKQKHRRTHKRKGLKKRKKTRRKGQRGGIFNLFTRNNNPEESGKSNDERFTTTYNDAQQQQKQEQEQKQEQQEVAVNTPIAVINELELHASQAVRDQMTKPIDDNTPIHIIFSHKGRMQCILNSLYSKNKLDMDNINGSAEEPANGCIIVLARTPLKYKGFYHNSQYKSSKGQDMNVFFEAFKLWWKKLEETLVAENEASAAAAAVPVWALAEDAITSVNELYIFVRHGYGWHNSHKYTKFLLQNNTPGEGLDSSLLYEPEWLILLLKASVLLNYIITHITDANHSKNISLYCSDLQRTMQTARFVLYDLKNNVTCPDTVHVLPCNNEFTCVYGETEEKRIKKQVISQSQKENTTSIGSNVKWGEVKDNLPIGYNIFQNLKYDDRGYLDFFAGVPRGQHHAHSAGRKPCRDFPENINFMKSWTVEDARRAAEEERRRIKHEEFEERNNMRKEFREINRKAAPTTSSISL